MNNYFALFSGTILDVEVSKRKTEFGTLKHQTVILECVNNNNSLDANESKRFYLRSWGDKDYEIGKKVHLLCTVEYKRVKSKNAVTKDGNIFEYGAFDFTIAKQMNNAELVKWHKSEIKKYDE